MAVSRPRSEPRRILVMGVSGSGKSTIGRGVAAALGIRFVDGDDLHPAANVAKMAAGTPLTDNDRAPWLDAVGIALGGASGDGMLVACSALKRTYRDRIRARAGRAVTVVYLDGDREVIAPRLRSRTDHFMPEALLDSQFAALEPPAPEEGAIEVAIDRPAKAVIADCVARICAEVP